MNAYLGVGSNIDPETNLIKGLKTLQSLDIKVKSVSTHYKTEALNRKYQQHYINGVWLIEGFNGETSALQMILKRVEKECDRIRTADPYSSRTLDLDIIWTEDYASQEILNRDFVYIPLLELNRDLVLSGYGMLKEQVDWSRREEMCPLSAFTEKLRSIIGE